MVQKTNLLMYGCIFVSSWSFPLWVQAPFWKEDLRPFLEPQISAPNLDSFSSYHLSGVVCVWHSTLGHRGTLIFASFFGGRLGGRRLSRTCTRESSPSRECVCQSYPPLFSRLHILNRNKRRGFFPLSSYPLLPSVLRAHMARMINWVPRRKRRTKGRNSLCSFSFPLWRHLWPPQRRRMGISRVKFCKFSLLK